MPFQLVGIDNEYGFELRSGATMVVGRAVESDYAVVDATVSRRHAELTVAQDGVQVLDVGSSNGTFVNGMKVESYFVVPGDTLVFGKVAFRVEELAATPPGAPLPRGTRAASAGSGGSSGGSSGRGTIVRPVTSAMDAVITLGTASGSIKAVMAGDAGPAEKDRQKLQILLEVAKGLARSADVNALLEKVADYAFQILESDRCAIVLADDEGQLDTRVSRDRRGAEAAQPVPQSIVRMAIHDRVAVLSDNAGEDHRFGGQSILTQGVRSALCAPLLGSAEHVLGVLYVDNSLSAHRFSEADLDFLIAFAGIAAVAIEHEQFSERIRREAIVRENFERFFTPQLAARIASSADALRLGGDRRPVAVLFSDIRGFTALSRTMNPEEMARLLSEYFTEMVECVFRRGGTLDKFIGDAVMAQWGAPVAGSDDADQAMAAAIDMMQALDRLNEGWRAEGRPALAIGIGLNFGEAFAGNIGSERRLEYTVIGDTVNAARRLCSAAAAGEILVSGNFHAQLTSPPRVAARPPIELAGDVPPLAALAVLR